MRLNIPTKYEIKYPLANRKYYSAYSKPIIAELLYGSCKGFCMYCGKTVNIEGDRNFQIEHAVDKEGNLHSELDPSNILKHCKFNLASACPECNQVCKKAVDKIDFRSHYEKYYKEKDAIPSCPASCDAVCELYSDIRNEYIKKNAIILQPIGIDDSYGISFDLVKHIYIPDAEAMEEMQMFITQNHIDRFRLNDDRFSPSVVDICNKILTWYDSGVVTYEGIKKSLEAESYQNILGEIFEKYIVNNFVDKPIEKLISFCKLLIILEAVP